MYNNTIILYSIIIVLYLYILICIDTHIICLDVHVAIYIRNYISIKCTNSLNQPLKPNKSLTKI